MKKLATTTQLAVASVSLGLMLAAGPLAIANVAPDASFDGGSGGIQDDEHIEEGDFPIPVVGDELFTVQSRDQPACMERGHVIAALRADQAEIGGRTVEIVAHRYQEFANRWRDRTGVDRVAVSGIVVHLFFDRLAVEWTADLVEFNAAGCAMSRTLMSKAAWDELLAPAKIPSASAS